MKLIKINPQTQTVETVETTATLSEMYQLIGCRTIDVCARQDNGDSLTVDDEALLDEPQPPAFYFDGFGPIHGMALVTGVTKNGRTKTPTMTLDEVIERVEWLGAIHTEPFLAVVSWHSF